MKEPDRDEPEWILHEEIEEGRGQQDGSGDQEKPLFPPPVGEHPDRKAEQHARERRNGGDQPDHRLAAGQGFYEKRDDWALRHRRGENSDESL